MNKQCPNPNCAFPKNFILDGKFRRKEDSKLIQRYRCKSCGNRYSNATFMDTYRQKKRRINFELWKLLASNLSMRRAAIIFGVDKKTIERKLIFLGERSRRKNEKFNARLKNKVFNVQIDDLITKENSKLKPLSVTIAVEEKTRFILSVEVSQIPSFGHLAHVARKKYGYRKDYHDEGLTRTFKTLAKFVNPEVLIKSDEHQRYPTFVSSYFPRGKHLTFKSERACIAGQGELKKTKNDPLFYINHTCATLRANVNRLIRKTWCTTKDPKRLKDHLDIYIHFHNEILLAKNLTPL